MLTCDLLLDTSYAIEMYLSLKLKWWKSHNVTLNEMNVEK